MANRWQDLRTTFKAKNRDLDAEFEKFLNESLSDESVSSPRRHSTDFKSTTGIKAVQPKWTEEEGSEISQHHLHKPNQTTTQNEPSDSSGLDGTALSKDSLEEGTIDSISPGYPRQNATRLGLDTLNEEEEKRQFFDKEEEGASSSVDYQEKLQELSATETPHLLRDNTDYLQATGAELGESIFNQSDEISKPQSGEEYSEGFEESATSSEDSQRATLDERPSAKPTDVAKPSMLSKVSLMESLDSTLDGIRNVTGPPADRKHNDKRTGEEDDAALKPTEKGLMSSGYTLDAPKRTRKGLLSSGNTLEAPKQTGKGLLSSGNTLDAPKQTGKGLLSSGTTVELRELEAALLAAQLTTASEGLPDPAPEFELPPTPTVIQAPSSEVQERGHMMLEKMPGGATRAQGFDLEPIIVNDVSKTSDDAAIIVKHYKDINHTTENTASFTAQDESAHRERLPLNVASEGLDARDETREALNSRDVTREALDARDITREARDVTREALDSRDITREALDSQDVTSEGLDSRDVTSNVSHPEEGRGFTLQPLANLVESTRTEDFSVAHSVGDSRIEEDDDIPPAESLRGIKSIARARRSAGLEENGEKTRGKAGAAKKGVALRDTRRAQESVKKGKGKLKRQEFQPSPSSVPTWSPTPNTRRATPKTHTSSQMIKRPTSQGKSTSRAEQSSVDKTADKATDQLMTSVDSFANYLKQFVRPDDNQAYQPPPVLRSSGKPSQSAPRGLPSETQRLSREKALQEEVANWQMAWKDERRRNDKLIVDIAAREKENFTREEKSRLAYQQQIHDLQQEVLLLRSKLESQEEETDVKRRVLSGASLQGASKEELQRMEKEIREQEELLKGYQVENERLYKELKQVQAKTKASEARLFSENQKLVSEVLNLKENVEQLRPAIKITSPGSAYFAAEKLADLQAQVASLRRRETELQSELTDEKESKVQLEMRLRREQATTQSEGLKPSVPDLHAAELEKLHRKLKWYAENQQLLDRDTAVLQKKEREIQELRDTIARLQAHHDQTATEKSKRNVERTADAKRIQDLERQVREMEEIIRRRYPNSLPALIYAAASAPGHAQLTKEDTPKKQTPSHVFLENRIKKLETQLEEKENEAAKRMRVIEQKYNAMKFGYEDRIRELDKELKLANERLNDASHSYAESLEKDLLTNQRRVKELQTEVQVLQDALTKASASAPLRSPRARRRLVEEEERHRTDNELQNEVKALEENLQTRNAEVEELRQTCGRLQREREQMLVGADKTSQASAQALSQENSALNHKLSRLEIEVEQERVRHQASRAEAERVLRQTREEAADMAANVRAQHRRDVNEMKAGFAVSYSTSKMAELQSKVTAQEVVIQRLKENLTEVAGTAASLTTARVRQETQQERIEELEQQLRSAKERFSPEMKHFDALETKVVALERKQSQRERELQRIIDSNLIRAQTDMEETETKWRQVLQQKHQEMDTFRSELDAILEVLSELRRQGIMIPFRSQEAFYS